MAEPLIRLTEAAARRVHAVLAEHGWKDHGLRFGLQDGGCSGYSYMLDFEERPEDEDLVHEEHGVRVFIHPLHVPFVQGTVLDWKEGQFESGFDIQNPHASRHCGCGESFDVS